MMRWARYGRVEKCIGSFGRNPVGKKSLAIHRIRWEDNIKIDIKEMQEIRLWTGFIWLRLL
jgi:hypothetical protein